MLVEGFFFIIAIFFPVFWKLYYCKKTGFGAILFVFLLRFHECRLFGEAIRVMDIKLEKRESLRRTFRAVREPDGLKRCINFFPSQTKTWCVSLLISSWLVWRSCDGTYQFVIWRHAVNISSYFTTFAHSLYKTKRKKKIVSLFLFLGGECIVVKKKVVSEQSTSCCLGHICIFVMCWKINTRKPTLQ